MEKKNKNFLLKNILTILFGWTGWQRFAEKKYVSGAVFLLTGGLLLIGWAVDAYTICKENIIKFFNI